MVRRSKEFIRSVANMALSSRGRTLGSQPVTGVRLPVGSLTSHLLTVDSMVPFYHTNEKWVAPTTKGKIMGVEFGW
jgi:hypothetical protein